MTGNTGISVLMKCTKCRHEEEVPKWVLEELEFGRNENGYKMACPCCDRLMLEKSIFENSNIFKPKKKKKKR